MNNKEKAKQLPETPGVYLMKNQHDRIIYVGKAKNLKRRVSSYFINSKNHSNKVKQMVQSISDFDYLLVDTEFDALLLECQLIHRYRPLYNQQMNHYEEYGYFQLLTKEPYLNVLDQWSDQGLVIGPFYKKGKMLDVKAVLNSVYRLNGPLKFVEGIVAPYSEVAPNAEFELRLAEIKGTLLGQSEQPLKRIEEKVAAASQKKDYERAQQWWEKFLTLQRFLRRNKQLLAAMNATLFLGALKEADKYYYYLYFNGEVISHLVYQRPPAYAKIVKKIIHQVPKSKWRELAEKPLLTKAEVDLFPIFFNYLNRHGTITTISDNDKNQSFPI